MKKLLHTCFQMFKETKKILWPFKGTIFFYWLLAFLPFYEWINPPKKDDPIFRADIFLNDITYTNYEVYMAFTKLYCVIYALYFLLATSNIKNHPKLARILLLFPWLIVGFACVVCIVGVLLHGTQFIDSIIVISH